MTSLYEYKHPIINKQLASGTDDQSGRKFPSLDAWYNVVNDYEFQARCPIILKNSHRNKHFTFACHLKDCPFKVLLSYCGNQSNGLQDDLDGSVQQHGHESHGHESHDHSLASMDHKPKLEDPDRDEKLKVGESEGQHAGSEQHGQEDAANETRKYTDADAEDDDVSAAIAAAVAAVQDVRTKEDSQFGEEYMTTPGSQGATTGGRSPEAVVRGPFVVTKIEPYHNHPLESNLSLSKFVLTKVPRILQHDLNFDQILESLCNEEDNTVSKFRVSQYVEESGLLDILKERYGLTDADIDKKLLSHISRRVTTYKARFVLKKKKNGDYGTVSEGSGNGNGNGTSSYGQRSTRNASMNPRSPGSPPDHHHQMHHHQLHQLHHGGDEHENGSNSGSNSHLQSLEDSNLNPELNDDAEAQAAAQAAIGEAAALKRSVQQMVDQEDADDENARKRQMMKLTASMHGNLVNDDGSLVSLDDTQDDKLPRDVAEQLRLLSSHFKEVEAHNLGNSSSGDGDDDSKLTVKDEIPDENIQPELRGQ